MFLVDSLPGFDGPQLARLRAAFTAAFDQQTFAKFSSDYLNLRLDVDVAVGASGFDDLLFEFIDRRVQDGTLRQLLFEGLRARADQPAFRRVVAPVLGVEPLVQLAELLGHEHCAIVLFSEAARGLKQRLRDQLPVSTQKTLLGAWLDKLLWLDDLSRPDDREPPLRQVLGHIHASLIERDPEVASRLVDWAVKNNLSLDGTAGEPDRSIQRVAIELRRDGSIVTWRINANREVEHLRSISATIDCEQAVQDALRRVVDECFARDESVAPNGVPVRFEFILPKSWLRVAVDQLTVGAGDETPAAVLSAMNPVVVAWESAWRSPGKAFGRIWDLKRKSPVKQIGVLSKPADWPAVRDHASLREELSGWLVPFEDFGQGDSILEQCLQTPILVMLWIRSGCCPLDEDAHEYLEKLVENVDHIPHRVFEARRATAAPGAALRRHLALLWHAEKPIELPEPPFEAPPFVSR